MSSKTTTVLIAGATGYAGRKLVEAFVARSKNYTVKALVRRDPNPAFPDHVELVRAEATQPDTLVGIMTGVDMVVSALGITRQRDGLTYQKVDYQANINLLQEAERSDTVRQFGYIHVIHGDVISDSSAAVAAKQAFVDRLQASTTIRSTVVCPSGFFSDMNDFLEMAKTGRAYLFGKGNYRLNPIHGADLAEATVKAMEDGTMNILSVGGPDVYSHTELATLAFEVMNKPVRLTYLWDGFRRMAQCCLPWITPISIYGPAQFFLAAFSMDMVGECTGRHHLKEYWMEQLQLQQEQAKSKTT